MTGKSKTLWMPATMDEPKPAPDRPKPADVISYAYLWKSEADRGQTEGVKDRPCLVLAVSEGPRPRVVVAPFTTKPPSASEPAVKVPGQTAMRLGLEDKEQYVYAGEVNVFLWPGPDLRRASRHARPFWRFGAAPAKLFEQVRFAFFRGRSAVTRRTE